MNLSHFSIRLPRFLGASVIAATFLGASPLLLAQFNNGGNNQGAGGQGARQYLNNTMIGDALIEVDPETRTVIVITDEETNLQVTDVIRTLDRPKPQVLIKVVFLEVTHRDDLDFGVQGGYTGKTGSATSVGQSNFGLSTSTNLFQNAFGLASAGEGGIYQLLDTDFGVTLRAIAEAGKLEVLSRPSILARNNQEAIITVGQEVPFIRNTRFLQDGQQVNTVEYEDIGIILRVTPFITQEGMVEMIIAPEISTLTDQTVTISAGVEAPVFAKRSAETVVVTPHAKTVIIGGLMERNSTQKKTKIPILGDIPFLGAAFSRTIKDDTKTELLIFLTPYVVQDPSELGTMTTMEQNKTTLTRKAFSEDELNRFLDGNSAPPPPNQIQTPAKKRRWNWLKK